MEIITKAKFRFIGRDSLGYKNGEVYTLELDSLSDGVLFINRDDRTGECMYSNVITFMRNWELIK